MTGQDFVNDVCVEGDVLYACFWCPFPGAGSGVWLFDISDPLDIQPLARYAEAGNGGQICVAGDLAYLTGYFRLDVLDVRDPASPQLLYSVPTTSSSGHLGRAGDFLFCGWTGLHSFRVFDRLVDETRNAAQSLILPNSGLDLSRIRLEALQEPTLNWEISADGGTHWQAVPADGSWQTLHYPGAEPLWRATLLYSEPGSPPLVDEVMLEWVYDPSSVPGMGPNRLALHPNAPNPFNLATTIHFDLLRPDHVLLEVFDSSGRLVRRLLDQDLRAGRHAITWQGQNDARQPVSSGVYLCRLRIPGSEQLRKIDLVR
jgi:hypothetical protein